MWILFFHKERRDFSDVSVDGYTVIREVRCDDTTQTGVRHCLLHQRHADAEYYPAKKLAIKLSDIL